MLEPTEAENNVTWVSTYALFMQTLRADTSVSATEVHTIFKQLHESLCCSALSTPRTPEGTPLRLGARSRDGCFWRPCSWKSSLEPCWIMSELRLWNVELSINGFQLHNDISNELTLSRYDTPEGNEPTTSDVLRVSLLLHVLLVRHRCVTHISVDLQRNNLDRHMLCSALNSGAAGLKYLKYKGSSDEHIGVRGARDLWARSIASVSNLNTLCVARVHMDECVASALGEYVEHSWSIREINLRCVSVFEPNASLFLNSLARNRTVERLCLEEPFLTAQQGHALAAVLRKHVVLAKISMIGAGTSLPSELLRAVVRSPSLKWLDICDCRLRAEDVEAMAAALALPSTASVPAYDGVPPASPLASMCRLETIVLVSCAQPDRRLEEAYANLIAGGLVRLMMFYCCLGRRFAMLAACKLRADTRMRELSVMANDIPAPALCLMVQALEVNKTLESLGIGTLHSYSCTDLACLFDLIRGLDCWSRVTFGWIMPCGSQFSDCLLLSKENTVKLMLDELIISDAEPVLDSFASSSKIRFAEILCSWEVESLVLGKLIDTLRHTRQLRFLYLRLDMPDEDVAALLRCLEKNRSIYSLKIWSGRYEVATATALGEMVANNRTLCGLFLEATNADDHEYSTDVQQQLRYVCSVLADSILGNHSLLRLKARANRAVRFVRGSMKRIDALAFDVLEHSGSIILAFCDWWHTDMADRVVQEEKAALASVAEARRRLNCNYFIITGVVKTKISCTPSPTGRRTFEKLGENLRARICSFLRVADVLE